MATFIIYLLIVGVIIYFVSKRGRFFRAQIPRALSGVSQDKRFCSQRDPREIWKQVYETASMDEARSIQTRLEEEGIESILYEQGKKDIHGNLLKGVGVVVPNAAASLAQVCIAKMPA